MKNIRWTIMAALILAVPTIAQAQRPDDTAGSSGQAPGVAGTTATADSGTISSTSSTTTTSPGMDAMASDNTLLSDAGTSTVPNTGGEPLLMSLAGMSLAAGAFFLRRRVLN